MNPQELEQKHQDLGHTAPRVTVADLEGAISASYYFTAGEAVRAVSVLHGPHDLKPLDLLTICVLVINNGFTVVGKSAPASPENFDLDLGRKLARDDAVRQLWPLMGFALRERLHSASA